MPSSRADTPPEACLAILYIEDQRLQRHLISRLVAALDADITLQTAPTLGDALSLCAQRRFDAVLLDLNLPDSQGAESLARLQRAHPRLPIVVFTESDDRELAMQVLAAGAQDYLVKSQVTGSALLRTIRYAIERNRTALALEAETARLRASEQRLDKLFELSPVPLYEFEIGAGFGELASLAASGHFDAGAMPHLIEQMRLVGANRAALQLSGARTLSDFASLESLVPPRSLSELAAAYTAIARGEQTVSHEVSMRRIDGEERSVRMSYTLLSDPEQAQVRLIVAVVDLTERRREELQRRLLAVALEATSYAVVITDVDGAILWVNRAFSALTGYAQEEALGRNPRVLKSGTHPPEFYRQLWQRLRAGLVWDGEVVNRRKDGSLYSEHMTITPVRADGAEITHFIAVKYDISERKALEARLMQAQKLESIGQLAAGVAHEINTPIQFIGDNLHFLGEAFAELLPHLAGEPADATPAAAHAVDLDYYREEVPRALRDSLEGVDTVAKIVRSLKAFAHPGADDKSSVEINKVIDNALTISRNEWKYAAELTLDLAEDLPAVPGHPTELGQVFLNIIVNAAQAIASKLGERPLEKGRIAVSSRLKGESVEVRISDTGCGIAPDQRARIFDLFYTTKDVGKGSGQGLAIAHAVIVEQHGGAISVESEPGEGTTFIVELPLAAPRVPTEPQPVA